MMVLRLIDTNGKEVKTVQRSIAFFSVSTVVILLLIGMLVATSLSVAATFLDVKPAFAKGKCPSPSVGHNPNCVVLPPP
jgi:dolichol kinase